jgi:hypothetical protein
MNNRSLFLIFFLFSTSAFAAFEEYLYFSESEQAETNSPRRIDSEYFSDILTYSLPLQMQARYLRSTSAYDLTVGSLGSTRFATQQRLRLDHQLNEHFTLRLLYIEKKDFEQSLQHFIVELQYHMNAFWTMAGFTELQSLKQGNDVGLASVFHLSDDLQVRFFMTAVDFSFNLRVEDNIRSTSNTYHYGFISRWIPSGESEEFAELYLTAHTPVNRDLLDLGSTYFFRDTRTGLRGRHTLNQPSEFLNWDVNYRYAAESELSPPSESPQGIWKNDQWNLLLQYENNDWLLGVASYLRKWDIGGTDVIQDNYLPHIWRKIYWGGEDTLRLGYEVTMSNTTGPQHLRSPSDVNKSTEHRANLRYSINFNERAYLHLQLSADMDDLGWEGGNGQFQYLF